MQRTDNESVSATHGEEWGDARDEMASLVRKGRDYDRLQAELKKRKGAAGVLQQIADKLEEITGEWNVWKGIGQLEAENKMLSKSIEKVNNECVKIRRQVMAENNRLKEGLNHTYASIKEVLEIYSDLGHTENHLRAILQEMEALKEK